MSFILRQIREALEQSGVKKKSQDEKSEDEMGRKWAIKCEKTIRRLYSYRFSVNRITIFYTAERMSKRESKS